MKKIFLEKFISKYNLGGSAEKVFLKAEQKNTLSVSAASEDKNCIIQVKSYSIDIETGIYAIYDTNSLKSLLSVLGDEIQISVQSAKGKSTSFLFKDGSTKVSYALADSENIPETPALRDLPPFDIMINIDAKFIEKFIKAKNALSETKTFTVLCNGKDVQLVIGHSDLNTNRVSMTVNASQMAEIESIDFSAQYLKEILAVNKEASSGTLSISSQGLAQVSFDMENFDICYYLLQIQRIQ